MRSTTVFFILGLVVLASATKEVNVFAEIDAHPFGSSLLDLVQMNLNSLSQTDMKTEDTVNQITELLQQIEAEMTSNKKQGDADHKSFQDKVNYEIEQNTRMLAEQRARRVATQQQLDNDRKQLAKTQADLKSAQAHLVSLHEQIKSADSENDRAQAAFEKKVSELNEAIAACKEAVQELAKLGVVSLAEGSQINMVQLKSGMEKVQKALKAHLPSQLTLYQPIITALVDMGTNADPVLVKKVVTLINQLRTALQVELAQAIKNEGVRAADYQQLRSDLVNDQNQTEKRIGRDLVTIQSLEQNIKQNQSIVDQLNIVIPATEAILASKKAQKKAEQGQYEKDNETREDELKVIHKLVDFFHEKFASHATGLSAHLNKRLQKH